MNTDGVTRRVVFLDIDGVLAPIRRWDRYGDLEPACIEVLNEIVASARADVVVSSTWRHGKTVGELQAMLEAEGFTGRVVDKTPTGAPGAGRGEEIAAWLARHPVSGYVIIDDHMDMGELGTSLVLTHPGHGLQPADAPRAIEILMRTPDPHEASRGDHMPDYIPSPREWVREQVELYERSGGTEGTTLRDTGLPVVIVTHTGNRTGAIRKTPLMRVKDGGRYVLVGSVGGAPRHPVWVYNLRTNPTVELRDHTEVQTMRVREVTDEAERARLWKLAVAAYPPYAEYQARTERQIPIFIAEPARGS